MENIFLADKKPISLGEYLQYAQNSRGNLGDELPVMVYRMLEYSMKDELIRRFGKETQIDIFRQAREEGRRVLCEAVSGYQPAVRPVCRIAAAKASGTENRSSAHRRRE